MKPPVVSDIPPLSPSLTSQLSAQSIFVKRVIVLCENTFRIIGFFVFTCLAFGLLAAACHQNPFLWVFVFFLGFLFWLYTWTVTLGIAGHYWVERCKSPKLKRRAALLVNSAVVVMTLYSFAFISFEDLIDAYVLRLFPDAQACDMYSGTAKQAQPSP